MTEVPRLSPGQAGGDGETIHTGIAQKYTHTFSLLLPESSLRY